MILGPRFNSCKLAFLSAVVLLLHGTCQGQAFAGDIATPTGLHAGDQFRFIFVTPTSATIDATSSAISDYNTLVNNYAQGFSYNGTALTAQAIVSTNGVNGVNAITNVNVGGVDNVAVYRADGQEVAASTKNAAGGLFYGDPLSVHPVEDLSGTSYSTGYVWTGSSGNGVEYYTNTPTGSVYWGAGSSAIFTDNGVNPPVNYDNHVEVGDLSSNTTYEWLSRGFAAGLQLKTNTYQVYGISQVFTVVPEPSSLMISGLGILMVGLAQRNRKRN